ncbi:hypothetical protein BGZ88_004900 [Linnemannia elongata]|nr:hypothetical protein BGZ88_004900 [Linnemannia elongata]
MSRGRRSYLEIIQANSTVDGDYGAKHGPRSSSSKPVWFKDVEAEDLTLWPVSIPIPDDDDDDDEVSIYINNIPKDDKKKLKATRGLHRVFGDEPAKNMIHVIVQRPPPVHTPVLARATTPLLSHLSDSSRPNAPLSGKVDEYTSELH